MTDDSLRGSAALITGAARRLGRAIALELARRGVDVIIHYHRSAADAEATVTEARQLGVRSEAISADLAQPGDVERLEREASERFGPIRYLVNNASIFEPLDLASTEASDLARNESLHVHAPLRLSRWLATQRPEAKMGAIVNLLDHRAFQPDPAYVPYSLSKAGLSALTLLCARELAPSIRVNSVSPGAILAPPETAIEDRAKHLERASSGSLLERSGAVEDVVAATVFLLVDAHYTTGIDLPVDGGRHLGC